MNGPPCPQVGRRLSRGPQWIFQQLPGGAKLSASSEAGKAACRQVKVSAVCHSACKVCTSAAEATGQQEAEVQLWENTQEAVALTWRSV